MNRVEEIRREAQQIQNLLEQRVPDDIAGKVERLNVLGVYYARSGAMHAEAVGLRDAATYRAFRDSAETISRLAPSLGRQLVKGATAELNALENWLDRINAGCGKQCDSLRTLISYEKELIKLA